MTDSESARALAPFIHERAICETARIGPGTRVWAFAHILPGAEIGSDCNICDGVFVENDVVVGDRVTIKSGVQLWDGVRLEDDVFVGPNATFTNDLFPRSKQYPSAFASTVVRAGASIGANATILPGVSIGALAMVGAGAVVTRSVPPRAVVVGNPARIVGYVDTRGRDDSLPVGSPAAPQAPRPLTTRGVVLYPLSGHSDLRGSLAVAEEVRLPFVPRRFFIVYEVPSAETRGEHAHRDCHQLLICAHGACSVVVDDGHSREEVRLDRPTIALYLPPLTWGIQYRFTADAALLVLASHAYDAADYIREYDTFLEIVGVPPLATRRDGEE